jgi:hypothetical protein
VSWRSRLLVLLLSTGVVLGLYVLVIADHGPSSQSAEIAVVIDGIDPPNDGGLRVDVLINVPVHQLTGCDDEVNVQAFISGTPKFWKRYAKELRGTHRVGIGLRTSVDHDSLRILDWKGYSLPRALINAGGDDRVPTPQRSNHVKLSASQDSTTGAAFNTAEIDDWGAHWTPLVMEFKASITSPRATGSCFLALPELIGVDTPTVSDADAAASGRASVFDAPRRAQSRGAVTFGRVIVRTNGRLLDGEARPAPDFVDGNPWVSELGKVGEEAAVWRCKAGTTRALWPDLAIVNRRSGEIALGPTATENDTCAGLAVIEARGSGTFRDAALLIVGGGFSLLFGALLKEGYLAVGGVLARRERGLRPQETAGDTTERGD